MKYFNLLFVLFTSLLYCQDLTAFNAIYTKTYLETSQKDFNKALKVADSLYSISETPLLKTKSLMLTASIYEQVGNFEQAANYALQSEKIIEETDNAIWKARVYGFLATESRMVKLFDQSKKYYEKGLTIAKEITNPEVANNTMALMMLEKAYYNIEQKNYKSAIRDAENAEEYAEKGSPSFRLNPIVTSYQILGYSYYYLKNFEESFKNYKKALELSKGMPETYLIAYIHTGLALLYIERNELTNAKSHLDIAERITEESKNPSLKNEVYEASEKYYAATKSLDDYLKVKEKHDTVKRTLQQNSQFVVNKSYSKIDKENVEIKKENLSKSIIIFIIAFLFVIGIILFLRYRKRHRANIEHFKQIIKEFDEKKLFEEHQIVETIEKDEDPTVSPRMMSLETERKILDSLHRFESENLFVDNNISLSSLATYCETNSKYLSHIINTHKESDFNNYINLLRINYVIHNLRNNPLYRKYKLATLAEEAGFSTPNKFSLIFKKVTSFSPSTFIKYLDEEDFS